MPWQPHLPLGPLLWLLPCSGPPVPSQLEGKRWSLMASWVSAPGRGSCTRKGTRTSSHVTPPGPSTLTTLSPPHLPSPASHTGRLSVLWICRVGHRASALTVPPAWKGSHALCRAGSSSSGSSPVPPLRGLPPPTRYSTSVPTVFRRARLRTPSCLMWVPAGRELRDPAANLAGHRDRLPERCRHHAGPARPLSDSLVYSA